MDSTYLFVSLVISSIGLGYFIYGKKQKHKTALYCGIGLIVFPYFVTSTTGMLITGLALMALPRFYRL
jgi:hypothetical protein